MQTDGVPEFGMTTELLVNLSPTVVGTGIELPRTVSLRQMLMVLSDQRVLLSEMLGRSFSYVDYM